MSVERAIERLLELWAAIGDEGPFRRLQPGLPVEEIEAALAAEGLPACPGVVTWYNWSNGMPAGIGWADVDLPTYWCRLTLEQAIQERRACTNIYAPDQWPSHYFPIARSQSGGSIALDTTSRGDDSPTWGGSKLGFEGEPAPSLEAVVEAWWRMFDDGVLSFSDGHWRLRDDLPAYVATFRTWGLSDVWTVRTSASASARWYGGPGV